MACTGVYTYQYASFISIPVFLSKAQQCKFMKAIKKELPENAREESGDHLTWTGFCLSGGP